MIIGNPLTVCSGGVSGSDVYAAISVTYPEGATCTATNGIITLAALDTNGDAIFNIPEPESLPEIWTITVIDGSDNSSETVSITGYGQVEVVSFLIPLIVDNASWATISRVSKAGVGDTYWDIGDCKKVHLQGTVGTLSLNTDLYVFILDFNHPIDKTTADNNIIWSGFKTALTGGIDVALCDSYFGSGATDGSKRFNINHRVNAAYGGWKGSDIRYDILGGTSTPPSQYSSTKNTNNVGYDATQTTITNPVSNTLMAALPNDLRSALRLWDRYIPSDAYYTSNTYTNPTIDAISLLTEYEIYGAIANGTNSEQLHQKQMAYYANGNSKKRYKHNAIATVCPWWESSPYRDNYGRYCIAGTNGSSAWQNPKNSYGLAPAFRT